MALFIGFLIFMVGLVACYAWQPAVWLAFKGLAALGLLFWGTILMLVGYSERKARREYQTATSDSEGTANS